MSIFCADLHIHSRFSRATSKKLTAPHLAAWSRIKGISVIATGDITHPVWREELQQRLILDEASGLYKLPVSKEVLQNEVPGIEIPSDSPDPLFLLQGEISSIYKKDGLVRKVHNMIFMPDFDSTEKLCRKLEAIGNLRSDGRPILGLDCRNLLEIVLEVDERGTVVPAHIWTPWFSLFGSKSGFNSLDECFGDLAPHIFALETGLSSDPEMNRLWSHLDGCALISNSDAHSGDKIGREANLFEGLPSYDGIFNALRFSTGRFPSVPNNVQYKGTVEFFPDEGKYYLDGHRACGVVVEPKEAMRMGNMCPVCGNELTIGVLHRILELADRTEAYMPATPPYYPFIPLVELLGEILGVGSMSKRVLDKYGQLIHRFGTEFNILHVVSECDLRQYWNELGEAIVRMRRGQVIRQGGYDGEYGIIRVFSDAERASFLPGKMFSRSSKPRVTTQEKSKTIKNLSPKYMTMPLLAATGVLLEGEKETSSPKSSSVTDASYGDMFLVKKDHDKKVITTTSSSSNFSYSTSQNEAIKADIQPILVLAGPGAGKTRTLIGRIEYLLFSGIKPSEILAVTFSRRAAEELQERIRNSIGKGIIRVDTLHALALGYWPKKADGSQPHVLSEEASQAVFIKANEENEPKLIKKAWEILNLVREKQVDTSVLPEQAYLPMFEKYRHYKKIRNMVDYSDLLEQWISTLQKSRGTLWKAVLVDEIQDLSSLQLALVKLLVPSSGKGFFGIGDPDQSIYGFRGAHPNVQLALSKMWPDIKVITLAENYRSVKEIVCSASALLDSSKQSKHLTSTRKDKGLLHLFIAPDYCREASWVASKVSQLIGGSSHTLVDARAGNETHPLAGLCSPGDIAILVRMKALMKPFQESLVRLGVPCSVPETELFWEDQRVALLLGLAGRKFGRPFGIQTVPDPSSIATHIWSGGPSALLSWLESVPPFDPLFRESSSFKKLLKAYKLHGSWESLLNWLCLRQEIDLVKSHSEQVQIMTIHASKGLEFKVIFLPALEEGLLPYLGTQRLLQKAEKEYENSETIAEEKRLLYVGMTRAKDALFLSYSEQRTIFGNVLRLAPSRFLVNLPDMFQRSQLMKHIQKKPSQLSLF